MALLLGEPQADEIAGVLQTEEHFMISAGTLAEALVVAGRRSVSQEMMQLLEGIGADVDQLSAAGAIAVSEAYSAWGKGRHPAGLNLGDCFAYVAAKTCGAPLLFVGDNFAKTDILSAL